MQKSFSDILASLNTRQREAVETIYWPVLVIAWPGSGKTQILWARIANILATTDYLPSNILCLTFTDNAARNMRERLATMIGPDAYRVAIHTFHSFGNEILNRYRTFFNELDDANTLDDITASKILDEILEKLPWNDPYKPGWKASETISEILGRIADLKKWGITPLDFETILEENEAILQKLTPLLQNTFAKIDTLGNSKTEKEEKRVLFEHMRQRIAELWSFESFKWYEHLHTVILRGIDEALDADEWDGSIKYITQWKESWTNKNARSERIWKESERREKQLSLARIYTEYQRILTERGYIDFADMILRAIEFVEANPFVQANLAEQYQFVLIDEFQDTNEAQLRLIRSILSVSEDSPNIFAVWDDDQSIYKFQWANTKNIRDFHDTWEDTKLIILDTNYRSKKEIINTSRTVIEPQVSVLSELFPGSQKQFESARWDGGHIRKHIFTSEIHEEAWIVHDIIEKINAGVSPQDIAIIVKKNKTLETLWRELTERWIPVSITKTESIFESPLIMLILSCLKYLESLTRWREASEILVDILAHPAWKIPRLMLWNIARDIYHARREDNKSWIENLARHETSEVRDVANFFRELLLMSSYTRLEDMIDIISGANFLTLPDEYDEDPRGSQIQIDIFSWDKKNYTSPLYEYFFGQLLNHKRSKYLTDMKKFVDEVRKYKVSRWFLSLRDAIELLSLIEKYDIKIEASHVLGNDDHSINLTTVHKAKWLEWSHVYVPHLHTREYKLGRITGATLPKNLPLEAEKDDDRDIERLVYTAFTRAADSMTLTYSRTDKSERANNALPCIQIENEEWSEITDVSPDLLTEFLETEKKYLFSLPYLSDETLFLRDRIEKNFTLSVTALQNFLDITSGGPEHFVANNILRFPQAKNIAASYGSAIHKWLEDFFADYHRHKTYQKEILHNSFETYLKKEGFENTIETEWLERGHENIEALYTEITGQTYGELTLEKDFRTEGWWVFLTEGTDEAIQLTGKIDRIERLPDDTLIVTDYKTGSGFLSFDESGSDYLKIKQWKYSLQLAFYAILFDLSPRYRAFPKKQYELFFVEKDQKDGIFKKIRTVVQQGEIDRTKRLILAVMHKIRTLDFPETSHYEQNIKWIRQFEEDLLSWQI